MIMIWAGLLTGFIMIGIKRCLHFLSPLQMPFVFLIVGLVVSVIIGTCISAAVASKIVRPVREVKKAMHRVEKGDFSQRLEVTGFNGEIDELIESYNKMAQELGGYRDVQGEFYQQLLPRVQNAYRFYPRLCETAKKRKSVRREKAGIH